MPSEVRVQLNVVDLPAFGEFVQRVNDFISEYAWHSRECAAIDADGEWHVGNSPCTCGYVDALAALVPADTDA